MEGEIGREKKWQENEKMERKLDVVQLCETQKVRLFLVNVMVGLMGLCG